MKYVKKTGVNFYISRCWSTSNDINLLALCNTVVWISFSVHSTYWFQNQWAWTGLLARTFSLAYNFDIPENIYLVQIHLVNGEKGRDLTQNIFVHYNRILLSIYTTKLTYLHFATQSFGYVVPSTPHTGFSINGHGQGFLQGHFPSHATVTFLKWYNRNCFEYTGYI